MARDVGPRGRSAEVEGDRCIVWEEQPVEVMRIYNMW